ncbi:MAG: hypothetical protein K0R72_1266 [Clostridia bacterium]|jgi:cytoskeletal protein RodZ|nr:hypothetical protein [Clostridia bacterium]
MNNTKKCNYCKVEINKKNKICPNCNKKQKISTWSVTLIVIIILLIFGTIVSDKDYAKNENLESNALATNSSNVNTNVKINTNTNESSNLSKSTSTTTSPSGDKVTKADDIQSNIILDNNSYTVYITKTGKKYHSSGCRYLSKSCIPINSNEAISEGYGPCSVCDP